MGDIGDYWREHREYKANKGRSKTKPEVVYQCSCGKKYYDAVDQQKMKDHMRVKKCVLAFGKFYDENKPWNLFNIIDG